MPLKTALAALVIGLLPGLSFAACFGDHVQQTMSCAEGQVWDETAGACVDTTA